MGVGGLKSSNVFVDSVVLNNKSIFYFCGWRLVYGGGGRAIKLMLFVDIINVRLLSLLYFMMFKSLG